MFRVGDYVQMKRCPEYTGLVLKTGLGGSHAWVLWNNNGKVQMHEQWVENKTLCKVDIKCPSQICRTGYITNNNGDKDDRDRNGSGR